MVVHGSTMPTPAISMVAALSAIILMSAPAHAGEIDTEHLFGFTIGTDLGEVGEKEIEGETTGRLGKRSGSYSAFSQALSLEYTPNRNLRLEITATGAYYDIVGVPELDDRRQLAFGGLSFDMRYRLLDRAYAPFGLAIDAEPHWGRVDETSGEPVDQYDIDLTLALDKELVPDRIVGAFNLLYTPEVSRSRITGIWSQQATAGTALAIMGQVRPDVFIGAEARYLRSYEGLGLEKFAGHALFLGPTAFARLSRHSWILFAWSVQVAGRAVEDPGALDLANFERNQATLKFGFSF